MRVSRAEFDGFIEHAREKVPGFTVIDGKRDSYLMNLIDGIIWPFTPNFMDGYITTIIGRVYFPKGDIDRNPTNALEVAGHEFIHAYDVRRLTVPLFMGLYLSSLSILILGVAWYGLFVNWVGLLPFASLGCHSLATAISFRARRVTGLPLLAASFVAAVGTAFFFDGGKAWWLMGVSLFALPLPAPGRYWAELRGYGMSLHAEFWIYGRMWLTQKIQQFTGPSYYWMWPFSGRVSARLQRYARNAERGHVTDPAFLHVQDYFKKLKASRHTQELSS